MFLTLYNAAKSRAFRRHIIAGFLTYIVTVLVLHVSLGIMEWDTFIVLFVFQIVHFFYGFLVTRHFIFKRESDSENFIHDKKTQAVRYAFWLFGFRIADGVGNFILIEWVGLSYVIAPILVMCVLFSAKFFAYRRFVFRTAHN